MGNYDFNATEKKWQDFWEANRSFAIEENTDKPKFYVLDMFPYPSGSGLHVGHPLGYIASDIVARYKWLNGFNVLHPMGFDAFGLPAEQYAIETGLHPSVTTETNIQTYRRQFKLMGLAYDPDTNVRTSDPEYYRWTQWIFLKMFHAWYDHDEKKALPIEQLIQQFEKHGNKEISAATTYEDSFTAKEWNAFSEEQQQKILLEYRIVYTTTAMVNWCPALGTVLANDEVIGGVSERGNHPVVQKPMRQWVMRITAYADRLLEGLNSVDWPEPMKEMQRHWIGRSEGAEVTFKISESEEEILIFTTRPDTLFGATFMVLAPEHELISKITSTSQKLEVEKYIEYATNRSELERISDSKNITGVFTGAYAIHPLSQEKVPVWIADYVLAGYGTGAIMAVPAHDGRDYAFAKHFDLDIVEVVQGGNIKEEAYEAKDGVMINSGFINGLKVKKAIKTTIDHLVKEGLGSSRVNFKLRDANFSRQRYWGEPIPIKFKNGVPYGLKEEELPVILPDVDSFKPGEDGHSPLANNKEWVNLADGYTRETDTLPGYAGSSWYFLRYLDPGNNDRFVSAEKEKYWMNVDLYLGGSEHAVGHLLYSRFWTKVLYDLGHISVDEPFNKLINQGMIQGRSSLAYRLKDTNTFVSKNLVRDREVTPIRVNVNFVENDMLDLDAFKTWRKEYENSDFELEDGKYICGDEIEKMSKRYHNVVNPDDICNKYGADTFRLYEMFLGPLEMSKPWNTNGIEGVFKFIKRLHNLFLNDEDQLIISDEKGTAEEFKILHKTIKKAGEDIEKLSFNTTVPQFMIFTNEMTKLNCHKREILEPFLVTLAPFAPHISEELWSLLGHTTSIVKAQWPEVNEAYLVESSFEYPVQINGKVKAKVSVSLELNKAEIEKEILDNDSVKKQLEGKVLKKVIVVPGRIINLVV